MYDRNRDTLVSRFNWNKKRAFLTLQKDIFTLDQKAWKNQTTDIENLLWLQMFFS